MSWFQNAVFYHIYPLGLLGCEQYNDYTIKEHRLRKLDVWIDHIADLGFTALYIGPLFESVGHGYETSDYRKLDSRLGDNEDLKWLVSYCHARGIKVILDAVFNHSGRDFFAFKDIRERRENSPYLNWYQNVNLYGNNSYNDGFSYDTWGGYDLLAKFNLYNKEVRDYHLETVSYWVKEFDIDGLRLDAADVLNFDFMKELRNLANNIKEDFFLLGEVIHGDYSRWVNYDTLHSVTNYQMHKALYSAHNDHNYFEVAHTIRHQKQICGDNIYSLYLFADNHDVERIASRISDKRNLLPLYILLYTLPGMPSVYYGSEFGIEGRKEKYSDASLRPALDLEQMKEYDPFYPELIASLSKIRKNEEALSYGPYNEVSLTTTLYAFYRGDVLIVVNNSDDEQHLDIQSACSYKGALFNEDLPCDDGVLHITIKGHSGEIYVRNDGGKEDYEPIKIEQKAEEVKKEEKEITIGIADKPYEEMNIEELQAAILAKMAANGPLNDQMIRSVKENVYRDSLLNWVKSFR